MKGDGLAWNLLERPQLHKHCHSVLPQRTELFGSMVTVVPPSVRLDKLKMFCPLLRTNIRPQRHRGTFWRRKSKDTVTSLNFNAKITFLTQNSSPVFVHVSSRFCCHSLHTAVWTSCQQILVISALFLLPKQSVSGWSVSCNIVELPQKPAADWKHSSLLYNLFYSWARPISSPLPSSHFNSLSLEST